MISPAFLRNLGVFANRRGQESAKTGIKPEIIAQPEITELYLPDSTPRAWLRANNTLFQYHAVVRMTIAEDLASVGKKRGNRDYWSKLEVLPLSPKWLDAALTNMDYQHGDDIPVHTIDWALKRAEGMDPLQRERYLAGIQQVDRQRMGEGFDRMRVQGLVALAQVIRITQASPDELNMIGNFSYNTVVPTKDLDLIASFFASGDISQQSFVQEILASSRTIFKRKEMRRLRDLIEYKIRASMRNPYSQEGQGVSELVSQVRNNMANNVGQIVLGRYQGEDASIRTALINEVIWPRNARR